MEDSVTESGPTAEVHDIYQMCYNQLVSNGRLGSRMSEDLLQTDTFEHGVQTRTAVPFSAVQFPMGKGPHAWKRRPRSLGLQWYTNYDSPDSWIGGRILVIDYVK